MNTPLRATCDTMFQRALNARLGAVIRTDNAFRCRKLLYAYRAELGNPDFASIQIRISPDDTEYDLWLLRAEPGFALQNYNQNPSEEIEL